MAPKKNRKQAQDSLLEEPVEDRVAPSESIREEEPRTREDQDKPESEEECRNPTLAKCGGEAQHLEKLEVGSLSGLPNVQSSIARPKTPCIGVFLVSLQRS
jgi:hypothetical protein